MQQKIIKLKVGEVFIDGKNHPVMKTFFQKTSKKGETFYQATEVAFVQVIEKKEFQPSKIEA